MCSNLATLDISFSSRESALSIGGNYMPLLRRRSFRPPLTGFDQRHEIRRLPQASRDASGHRGGHAQRAMDLDEVVSEIAERYRCRVVLNLLSK